MIFRFLSYAQIIIFKFYVCMAVFFIKVGIKNVELLKSQVKELNNQEIVRDSIGIN